MDKAVGLLEVQGYSVAMAAMDKACKGADVTIEGIDCNNPVLGDAAPIPVVVQVKFSGKIDEVKVALEVAGEAAKQLINEADVLTRLISSASDDLQKLLPLGKVSKK